MKKILLIVLVIGLLGGYLYYRSFLTGPKYSLLQAKEAAQSHNMAEFEKYVNVESLTGSLVDQITAQRSLISKFIPGLGFAKGAMDFLKPQLAKAARNEVQNYVETGNMNVNIAGKKPLISLAAIAGAIISDSSKFKGIDYVKEEGDQALVGLKYTQPRYDTTMVLEIKMLDKGDYWQATELTNVGELMKHVMRMEKHRLLNR
jgi:hypothetical protein